MRTQGDGLIRAELQEDGLLKWTRKFLVLNTARVSIESSGNEPRKEGIREPGRQHCCDAFWALVTDSGARTEQAVQEEVLVWQGRGWSMKLKVLAGHSMPGLVRDFQWWGTIMEWRPLLIKEVTREKVSERKVQARIVLLQINTVPENRCWV